MKHQKGSDGTIALENLPIIIGWIRRLVIFFTILVHETLGLFYWFFEVYHPTLGVSRNWALKPLVK